MRIIKFRVWDNLRQEITYGDWHITFNAKSWSDAISIHGIDRDNPELTDFEIHQFTGLQDSTGQDVYEGDLVEINYFVGDQAWEQMTHKEITEHSKKIGVKYICVVEWSDAQAGFVLKNNRSDIYFIQFPMLYCQTGVVKGNIFECKS